VFNLASFYKAGTMHASSEAYQLTYSFGGEFELVIAWLFEHIVTLNIL
jgi:hypothetical protein